MSDQKNRPVETLRDGNLKAAIWENEREDKTMQNVQFRKSYRDQDGQYRDTDSFGSNDCSVSDSDAIFDHRVIAKPNIVTYNDITFYG